jgi:hypothetical protein
MFVYLLIPVLLTILVIYFIFAIISNLNNQNNFMTQENQSNQSNQNRNNNNGSVFQLYYFLAIGFCIFFASIGFFITTRTVLVRYVFTKVDSGYGYYGGYNGDAVLQCENGSGAYYNSGYKSAKMPTNTDGTMQKLSSDELKKCVDYNDKINAENKERDYQNNMLNGLLTLFIPLIVRPPPQLEVFCFFLNLFCLNIVLKAMLFLILQKLKLQLRLTII